MNRAASIIRKLQLGGDSVSAEEIVRAVWHLSVGPAIASHTRVLRVEGGRLTVEVADYTWQRQLRPLEGQILAKLKKDTGIEGIASIQFEPGVRRIEPQRAGRARPAIGDEADLIEDPILRRNYKQSRKKALAG